MVDFKDLALEDVVPVESRPVIISTTYGAAMEEVNVPSDKTGHKVYVSLFICVLVCAIFINICRSCQFKRCLGANK